MLKLIISILLVIPFITSHAQGIGEIVPEKPLEIFPPNAFGFDILLGESGFGFGGFYRQELSTKFSLFGDISFSESKDDREFEYIDFFGNTFTVGKKNRVFQIPLNFGAQYRLFEKELTDNLRPYVNAAVGPTVVLTTPYREEFFKAFGSTSVHLAAGGYIGFGANFGLDKSNLIGLNFRYYVIRFFNEGVESLEGRFNKTIGGFYITINFGFMY